MAKPHAHHKDKPEPAARVSSRRVHYISGFDPRGARFYHRLYREEAAKQARHHHSPIEVGKRRNLNALVTAWSIRSNWEGKVVDTEYEFMVWDDIVRAQWNAGFFRLLTKGIEFYSIYLTRDWHRRVLRASKAAYYTSIFPITLIFLSVLLSVILGLLLASVVGWMSGSHVAGAIMGVLIACALETWALVKAERLGVFWVLRTCILMLTWSRDRIAGLEERIDAIAARIISEQKQSPVEEVLVVAHSVGSILAVSVMARIVKLTTPVEREKMHFFTLGECIPYLSLAPLADNYRKELEILGNDEHIDWTDATAPPDPLCFFQVDPIRVTGLKTRFDNRPRRTNVRIFRMFKPEVYAKMRRNKLRLHFQYLMASELPSDYDYFRITAGPEKFSRSRG